jgi:hypothetical protein
MRADGLAARIAVADWIAYRAGFGAAPGEIAPPAAVTEPARYDAVVTRVGTLVGTERQYFG